MRILIVDDDSHILEFAQEMLSEEGHEIRTATSGEEALSIFKQLTFDLIISDIQMPELNGIQLAYKLRETNSATPILFFSSLSGGINEYELKKIGNAKFVKDKNFSLLLETVRLS
jgi:DNA-binding response OmpR family regulator